HGLHGIERRVQLAFHLLVQRLVLGGNEIVQRRTLHLGAVDARVIAVIGGRNADGGIVVGVVGVVGEAIVLLLRIVQQQAELHALAGEFAIGERAHAGEDGGETGLRIGFDMLGGFAIRRPVIGHLLHGGDEQGRGRFQVFGAAVAIAVRAVLQVVVG